MHSIEVTLPADYRLYSTDSKGHFVDVSLIHAANDSAAWKLAFGLQLDRPVELWCGSRHVPWPFANIWSRALA